MPARNIWECIADAHVSLRLLLRCAAINTAAAQHWLHEQLFSVQATLLMQQAGNAACGIHQYVEPACGVSM